MIEAGFPIASEGETEAVKAIAATVRGPVIAGLARVDAVDIDRAAEAVGRGRTAAHPHVHRHQRDPHEGQAADDSGRGASPPRSTASKRARRYVDDVEFSCEDATRSDPEFLVEVFRAAADAGATTLNLPDTVGYALPAEFGALLTYLMRRGRTTTSIWSVHTHDDLGLAVANALAGVEAGARQVEVAVNGIGERAGNCSLEEVVMALRTRALPGGSTRTSTRGRSLARRGSSRC